MGSMLESKDGGTEVCEPINKETEGGGCNTGSMFESEEEEVEGTGCRAGLMSGVEDEGSDNRRESATVWPSATQPPTMQQCLRHIWHWHLRPTLVTAHFQ